MVMGIGRGDSARALHRPAAGAGGRVRAAPRDDQAVHERARRCTGTTRTCSSSGCARSFRRSRCGSPATGRRRSPSPAASATASIIQLADPEIIQWIMGTARQAAAEAGRDPAQLKCIVCAPSHITDDIADAREQMRWFPAMVSNHVKDLIERYGLTTRRFPKALTDYVEARKFYDYDEHSRVGAEARRVRHRRDLRPLLRARDGRAGDGEAAGARVDRRRPLLDLPDDPRSGGDADGVRRARSSRSSPAAPRRDREGRARRPAGAERIGCSLAHGRAGMGPSAAYVWDISRGVADRLVELLDPQAGETILELAAGPGDTGFSARSQLGRDGRLISTDVAPEMVAAAQERGRELGLTNVDFRVGRRAGARPGRRERRRSPLPLGLHARARSRSGRSARSFRVLRPGGRVALRGLGGGGRQSVDARRSGARCSSSA